MEPEKIATVFIAVASLILGSYNTWSIQNPPDSSDLLSQGNVYFSDGDYKSAIKCYEKALKLHNSYSNALKYKGVAYLRMGDPEQARKCFRSAEAAMQRQTS